MAHRNKQVRRTTNRFSEVPKAQISRSTFNRSHTLKTTFDAGLLVPILVDEALPGDTFNFSMNGFARLATPLKPVMDNLYLDTFFFAVPNRLVWDKWERFNGEQANPTDSTDFVIPTIPVNSDLSSNKIWDYMGIPVDQILAPGSMGVNALPFRAYNLIWNEWFRDQNLQTSLAVETGDGPDANNLYAVRRRGKRHDYFTSALPWPQKGPAVTIPLGDVTPVQPDALALPKFSPAPGAADGNALTAAVATPGDVTTQGAWAGGDLHWTDITGLQVDLSSATGATINSLRQAFQIQKLLERDARGGTRYTEIIKSHFGVTSPDARLQRPEYLGGGSSYVTISPVAQTNATASDVQNQDTPQGNLAAVGTTSWSGHSWTKSFTEHCVIIGLAMLRADLTYQQGVARMWSRQTRFDFFWPALQHLGEQIIRNDEIYAVGDTLQDAAAFGYQERYAEYRYAPSRISGKFRSTDPQTLDIWHLAQEFADLPTLSPEFIEENPPIDRVIAVQDEPHLLFDAYFNLKCARPMPVYGVPGLIDHF